MKNLLTKFAALLSAVTLFASTGSVAYAFPVQNVFQGGTGTSSPSGIMYGDNGATQSFKTLVIGTNLTLTNGTLNASAAAASSLGYIPWGGSIASNYGVQTTIATTSIPWAQNGIMASSTSYFVFASTTAVSVGSGTFIQGNATSTFGAGVTATVLNLTSSTASSTAANGISITAGCFAINNTCLQKIISSATDFKTGVNWASTTTLPAYVYSNGVSGVGATITETGLGALVIDNNNPVVGDRVLIKNEAGGNAPNNGVYTVTVAGSGVASFVLTRAIDFDQSIDIYAGVVVPVISGGLINGAGSGTQWVLETTGAIVIGTTNLSFSQYSGSGSLVVTYPILNTGNSLSLAFGTTTSNTWAGTQTFTNAPVLSSLTGVLQGNGASAVTAITDSSTVGQVLRVTGASTYAWGALNLGTAAAITGTLPAGNGGTGATSLSTAFSVVSNALSTVIQPSFTLTGTTTGAGTYAPLFGATTTLPLQQLVLGETINGVRCHTDTGTANVQFGNGTASTSLLNASSTNNFNAFTSNNTPTAGQQFSVDVGTFSGSPTKINCTVKITN